jgi:hypothetical protein
LPTLLSDTGVGELKSSLGDFDLNVNAIPADQFPQYGQFGGQFGQLGQLRQTGQFGSFGQFNAFEGFEQPDDFFLFEYYIVHELR